MHEQAASTSRLLPGDGCALIGCRRGRFVARLEFMDTAHLVADCADRVVRGCGLAVGAITSYGSALDGGSLGASGKTGRTVSKILMNALTNIGPLPTLPVQQTSGDTPIRMPA